MSEFNQSDIDVAASEENLLLVQAQVQYLQNRVVVQNLQNRSLSARNDALVTLLQENGIDVPEDAAEASA